ncbi:winged helix-turn-helix domain-containing protein [Pseudomonas qingdaonensis]|nr:winged helix-turn-helix domain-containing protein [Pseudomonas qingdaonensis]
MLELQRPDTLVERVVSAIRNEIDSGRLAAEARLPTEQQLAEQLNVSRSVVREAISQLKADGVLIARRGLGSYIRRTRPARCSASPATTGAVPTWCRCSKCACGSKPRPLRLPPSAATRQTWRAWPRPCRK